VRTNRKRAGSALIEFTLIGISGIFITISIATVALDMWEYYSLAYATEVTSRYAGLHGSNCATTPNSCTVKRLGSSFPRSSFPAPQCCTQGG